MQKLLTFLSKNIRVYAIFYDQRFNDTLTDDNVSFEQLGPVLLDSKKHLNGRTSPLPTMLVLKFEKF